jgi:hypothetical protein
MSLNFDGTYQFVLILVDSIDQRLASIDSSDVIGFHCFLFVISLSFHKVVCGFHRLHGEYIYIYICMYAHCEWIGPSIEFCRLNSTSIEKGLLPAQNQGRQNGRGHIQMYISSLPPLPAASQNRCLHDWLLGWVECHRF